MVMANGLKAVLSRSSIDRVTIARAKQLHKLQYILRVAPETPSLKYSSSVGEAVLVSPTRPAILSVQ